MVQCNICGVGGVHTTMCVSRRPQCLYWGGAQDLACVFGGGSWQPGLSTGGSPTPIDQFRGGSPVAKKAEGGLCQRCSVRFGLGGVTPGWGWGGLLGRPCAGWETES